jgi:hypothetical protein
MGVSWRTAAGEPLTTPLLDKHNPALVHDYEADGLLVYANDVTYDAEGRPIILYVTSRTWEPGPEGGPHVWRIARWSGEAWKISDIAECDNNYDMGSVYVERDGTWRVIGPLGAGPQRYNPGGEVLMLTSADQGKTWSAPVALTAHSEFNHTYVRRPLNAHPGFYAYWADGHGRQPSESRLYFYDRDADSVYRLPTKIEGDTAKPERVEVAR